MDLPGGFALENVCRCGKEACRKHVGEAADQARVVLGTQVVPTKYDLRLALRLEDFAFDGVCKVLVEVGDPRQKSITLHAKELRFEKAWFEDREATKISTDEEATTVRFEFGEELGPAPRGLLWIEYSGVLNNLMCGFYRSTYTNVRGEKKVMASTQFESIDARRCFPCVDEPLRKAKFACALRVPTHMTALSNMPEASSCDHGDGTKTIRFFETPRMSTYLVAFVVGEFDHASALTKNGVLVRCFVPPGKPELGRFSLECAVAALDKYDATFGIRYPLPKADMVAIPEFAAGAMENWGLVTYREVDMLIDLETASSRQKQRVAEVVIHELAHQWFGNLVTMEWWQDLWLNEGFATWMETGIAAELYPDWSLWEQFITDMQGHALSLDALRSSHPIQVPIAKAEEVEQVFDAISYCKGASVVRMVHAVVGRDNFLQGLRAYMREFEYGNATTEDLWVAWDETSGQPVSEMMGLWTKQTGFPLVEVVAWDPPNLSLRQSRFLADGAADDANALWMVPLTYANDDVDVDSSEKLVMMPRKATATLVVVDKTTSWIKLNANQRAPIRVKYPDSMIPELAERAIRRRESSAADRIGLVSDAAALSRAGKLRADLFMEIVFSFQEETDATVVSTVSAEVSAFSKTLRGGGRKTAPLRARFDDLARRKILAPQFEALGWEPRASDAHLTRKLRGELIAALPTFCGSDPAVVAEARRRFASFRENRNSLPSEYQSTVYKLVLANSPNPEATFSDLISLRARLDLNEEKKAVLLGLGAAPTDDLRGKALDFALREVKMQDFFYVAISMHASSVAGRDFAWLHFQRHFDAYKTKVGDSSSSIMDAVIFGACSAFATKEKIDEVEAFFKKNPLPRNERKIAQVLEAARTNANYLDAIVHSPALDWLEKYYHSSSSSSSS